MKYLFPLLCISLTCCTPQAPKGQTGSIVSEPTTESIEKLLNVSGIKSAAERSDELLSQALPDYTEIEVMQNYITNNTSWKTIKPLYVQAYKETFKQREVNDLIKFYESSTGKMLIKKQAIIDSKLMALHQQNAIKARPELQKNIEKMIDVWSDTLESRAEPAGGENGRKAK